jgi:hypothetical protein
VHPRAAMRAVALWWLRRGGWQIDDEHSPFAHL